MVTPPPQPSLQTISQRILSVFFPCDGHIFCHTLKASDLPELAQKSSGLHLRDKFSLLRPSLCAESPPPQRANGATENPGKHPEVGQVERRFWKHRDGLDHRCSGCSGGDERRPAVSRARSCLPPPLITPAQNEIASSRVLHFHSRTSPQLQLRTDLASHFSN